MTDGIGRHDRHIRSDEGGAVAVTVTPMRDDERDADLADRVIEAVESLESVE